MRKGSIRLLVAINKRPNFQTQRDSKIRVGIGSNSLGNRCCVMRPLTRIAIAGLNNHSTHGSLLEPVWNPLEAVTPLGLAVDAMIATFSGSYLVGAQGLEPWTR